MAEAESSDVEILEIGCKHYKRRTKFVVIIMINWLCDIASVIKYYSYTNAKRCKEV